jgi:hypothetical protein
MKEESKKKKFRKLWPTSKCCMKKALELNNIGKYGSIFVTSSFILIALYNMITLNYFLFSFISFLINLYFLSIVFIKLEMIKFDLLNKYVVFSLRVMIFLFLINSFAYLSHNSDFSKLVLAPMSFIGAYFIFLLLKRDSI